jgi:hypothetical protein
LSWPVSINMAASNMCSCGGRTAPHSFCPRG